MSFLENDFFLLAVTFGIFFFAKLLQKKTGLVLLNPILLTIAVLIIFLKMTHISYETYNKGGHLIEFWLRPAVVALILLAGAELFKLSVTNYVSGVFAAVFFAMVYFYKRSPIFYIILAAILGVALKL